MKRRRLILIGALAAVAAGLLLCWPRGPKEPVYQGKRLSEWIPEPLTTIEHGIKKRYEEEKAAAEKVFQSIGTNALPWLMSEFTQQTPHWKYSFNRWAAGRLWLRFRFATGEKRVATAGLGLQLLGTNAAPVLPTLARYLGDERLGHWASEAMGGAGEIALPYLLPALTSTNRTERMAAAAGLGNAVRHSDKAIPLVIELMQHTNIDVRVKAINALGKAKGWPDLVIPVFHAALSSPDAQIVIPAAFAVSGMGEVTTAVMPDLRRLLTNSNPNIVRAASYTVFRIDPAALPPRP